MFEITGDDIALLNDEDLRSVVGRLCEAELRRRAYSVSHATWGGDQTSKDGGLDVHVALPAGGEIAGFIPKPETGFQVKKSDMPRQAIIDEMRPNGIVRPEILRLAKSQGAYIIVSASGSTSFSALKRRREAMREALKGARNVSKLTLDFYDRNRIATWVRDHPGLIPWVRSLIGKSVTGWQSFGPWSRAPSGADCSYLFDEEVRIRIFGNDGDGLSAVDGINRIRNTLQSPGQVARLVGLSGVGKTRLCEALFDDKIGKGSLDPSLAFYANVAEGPHPSPLDLASDLIASQRRAILVIDNCPFALHRQLTDLARSANSTINVITVEYDIREDQPEGTDVFALGTSSLTLIEKLVQRRYPGVSEIDAQTVAEFSGGNARVALALAATIGKNESISGLRDADLFERLFRQRHEHNPDLLLIAQACSLVYSFEGVKMKGEGAELPILAGLVGKSVQEVYAAVAELKRRDLLQERSEWRAVLPHAISTRLAKLALQNIPADSIKGALVANASARLRRSFSRRLGYLGDSKEARNIVESWLSPGGMLADVSNLGEDERAMLVNVAPVMPDATLAAIECALQGADETTLKKSTYLARLLRSLAYHPAQFERAVALLAKLTQVADTPDARDNEAASILASLFQIGLSGTHAPLAMRLKVLEGLLQSNDAGIRRVGVKALSAMLKSDHFTSQYGFEFGALSRDYGYHPRTNKDVRQWFDSVMAFVFPLALSDGPVAIEVLKCIAIEFRGLWTNAMQTDALERLAKRVTAKEFWREGWIAARQTRIYGGKGMPADILRRLTALEESLRPKDLVDRVRGVVLGSSSSIDLDDIDDTESDDYEGAAARMDIAVENLGKDVAIHDDAFKTLLPNLVQGGSRVRSFGRGLGGCTEKPYETWRAFLAEISATDRPDIDVIGGFLNGLQEQDVELVDKLLDEALEHPSIGPRFVRLQASVTIDDKGVERLRRALDLGMAPIEEFHALAYGRASDSIPGAAFRDLVLAISRKPGGNTVALEILHMRLYSDRSQKRQPAPEVAEAGRVLLDSYEFRKRDGRVDREDRELGQIAQVSLMGHEGIPIVRRIVRDMMAAINRYDIYAHDQDDLITGLLRVHPTVVLDEMFSGDAKAQRKAAQAFVDLLRFNKSPLDAVNEDMLIEWCDRDPVVRYPLIAASATLFRRPAKDKPHEWTPLASKLIARGPDAAAVLQEIVWRLDPMAWSGSRASKLESRLKLLEKLPLPNAAGVAEAFEQAKGQLRLEIDTERKRESVEDRKQGGSFE